MVLIAFLHNISKGRIPDDDCEFLDRRIETWQIELRVQTTPVRLDVRMSVVVQQKIDLADPGKRLVNLNAIDMLR